MSNHVASVRVPAMNLAMLAAAPHRLLFFVGATNVLLAMTWWTFWLIDTRWHVIGMPQPVVPAGWLHAMVMQYQVLPACQSRSPCTRARYTSQSLCYATAGDFVLGRAPAHALFVGFFGSLLMAMVTRVTQGHSGRPLVLGKTAGFAFVVVQLVASIRVLAELVPDSLGWHAIAASGWILALLPWVVRSSRIYLSARIDGQPG